MVRLAVPLEGFNGASPAKLAPTPLPGPAGYVLASMNVPAAVPSLLRCTVFVATPSGSVVPVPTDAPFRLKAMVFPLTPAPVEVRVSVADRVAWPPYDPV